MDITISPSTLSGTIDAITSKSMAHRLYILAATCGLADCGNALAIDSTNDDMEATLRCLRALGAQVEDEGGILRFTKRCALDNVVAAEGDMRVTLPVGESGSTLRFLIPVVAALGRRADFACEGRLSERPIAPLDRELACHGAHCTWDGDLLHLDGQLSSGRFVLPGDVSSQFASGLLLAAPLLEMRRVEHGRPDDTCEQFELLVAKPVESLPYIDLTIDALACAGYEVHVSDIELEGVPYLRFTVDGAHHDKGGAPDDSLPLRVEGDWSNAAFWLAADALGAGSVIVRGLNPRSRQGDRAILVALTMLGAQTIVEAGAHRAWRTTMHAATIDVQNIPDLVPPLATVAATAPGTTRFTNASRLRLKESDRLQTVRDAICALGGKAEVCGDELHVTGVEQLRGGTVDAAGDHRIAMMAAICGVSALNETTISGAECVAKSYPRFFDDLRALGGQARAQEG